MHIIVIGAGAVGGYVGGKLALDGHNVTLVGRAALVQAVQAQGGVCVIEPGGESLARVQAVTDVADALGHHTADLVLFTVKGYDTQAAGEGLKPHANQFSRLLSLQNGISNEGWLAQAFGENRVLAGTITHPITVPQPGVVRCEKKRGGIVIAPLTRQSVDSLVETFKSAGLKTRAAEDAPAVKWSKLLLNMIGNATSAILDMDSRQVFADAALVRVEVAALREALAVMRAQGIDVVDLPGYPVRWLAWAVRSWPMALLQPVLRQAVMRGRAEKLPSLLLEVRKGRGRSEIEDMNGAVVRAGQQVKVPVPVNEILTTTLSLLVNNPEQRERWREQSARLVAVIQAAQKAQPS